MTLCGWVEEEEEVEQRTRRGRCCWMDEKKRRDKMEQNRTGRDRVGVECILHGDLSFSYSKPYPLRGMR